MPHKYTITRLLRACQRLIELPEIHEAVKAGRERTIAALGNARLAIEFAEKEQAQEAGVPHPEVAAAFELGFRCHERGMNLQAAQQELAQIYRPSMTAAQHNAFPKGRW